MKVSQLIRTLWWLIILAFHPLVITAQETYAQQDDSLMNLMTIDEKIGQLNLVNPGGAVTGAVVSQHVESKIKKGNVGGIFGVVGPEKVRRVQEMAVQYSRLKIPKDLIVFEFETNKYLPNHLVENGYTVVNTSWKPLYVVRNGVSDATPAMWTPQTIYSWNLWRWENWWDQAPSFNPIQIEETSLVIGAQMCSWEQTEEVELPTLRKRLPAFVERVWNTTEKVKYDVYFENLLQTDQMLTKIVGDDSQDSLLLEYDYAAD